MHKDALALVGRAMYFLKARTVTATSLQSNSLSQVRVNVILRHYHDLLGSLVTVCGNLLVKIGWLLGRCCTAFDLQVHALHVLLIVLLLTHLLLEHLLLA